MAAVSSESCSSCTKLSQAPVVLRVKRMRDEDPAEALAIHRKRERLDESRTQAVNDSKEVFCLCGTLSAKTADDHSVLELIKYFKDRRNQVKPNPLAKLSLDDHQKQTRAERKAHSVNRRYKLVSELRSVDKCVSPLAACNSGKDEWLHHIDVEIESHASDIEMRVPNVESAKDAPESAITCNSAVMVREKLVPEDKSVYVYDFYYVESQDVSSLDWSTLSAYTQEVEFVHDIIDSSDEELYDDEDDSNDESNWRNDYPDEEEEEESSLSEDMDNSYYSYRHKPYNDEFEPYYPEQYCGQLDSDEEEDY